jgi:FkbM family methyltransferase
VLAKITAYAKAIGKSGFISTLSIICIKIYNSFLLRYRNPVHEYKIGKIRLSRSGISLYFRYASSDINVISQIFIYDEYRPLLGLHDAGTIIDCGANAGYSTVYFLHAFPKALVIAIEPDTRNFKMLELNIRQYGNRVIPVKKAVWSRSAHLRLLRGPEGKGTEWATIVRECRPGEKQDTEGNTIDSIIRSNEINRIDIIKIDIEGAEKNIFLSRNDWIENVRGIAIEVHDRDADRIFRNAISPYPFRIIRSNELLIALLSDRNRIR